MRSNGLVLLRFGAAMAVLSIVLSVGPAPHPTSASGTSAPIGAAAAAGYRITLRSCWTNPPPSCAYGGVHAGSKYVTLIATVSPALQGGLSMRIRGQRYHPSVGKVILIINCGQQTRCSIRLQTAKQGVSAWNFWVAIVNAQGKTVLKAARISVAFVINAPSHLELWINGAYHTEQETFNTPIVQLLGKPLHLEARWRGARLDGSYVIRFSDGDTPDCTDLRVCNGWLTPFCTSGTTCTHDDLRSLGDGRVHHGRIYYAELWKEDGSKLLDSTLNIQKAIYVNWCDPPAEPCT